MISAAQAEPKKPSDTDSWGTSCLSPPFQRVTAFPAEPKKPSDTDSWGTSCLSPPFLSVTAFPVRFDAAGATVGFLMKGEKGWFNV